MKSKKHFTLYSSCIPVAGARRAIICDLIRSEFYHIPTDLFKLIPIFKLRSVNNIKRMFSINSKIIDEYIEFLEKNELGFWVREEFVENFTDISLEWDSPFVITNLVVDNDHQSNHKYNIIIEQIEQLRIPHIQYRFFSIITLKGLKKIMDLTVDSRVRSVEILIKYCSEISESELIKIFNTYTRIKSIVVFGCKENKLVYTDSNDMKITFINENISSANYCGNISKDHFSCNISNYTESVNYNSCLNRKIGIDIRGNIKNCPSMKNNYGNINSVTLKEAVEKPGFKDLWYLTKDRIEVCKDCEYRYICSDCRAFLKDPDNIYSQPLKCKYNPYIAKWRGEEDWISV